MSMVTDKETFQLDSNMGSLESELSKILGLEELECMIYLFLIRHGPMTASALAKEMNIDRARMYRTIDKLVNTSIISTTFTSPRLCIPMEPNEALELSIKQKEDELKAIKKTKNQLLEKLNNVPAYQTEKNIPTFRLIKGRNNIYTDIERLIENATETVYITTTLEDVSRMYHSNIPEKIALCEKNGGRVRLIVDIDDPSQIDFVTRFNATETRIGKLPSNGRTIIEEGKEMIMSDPSIQDPLRAAAESDFSVCTNSKEMVNNIFLLCEFLWNGAKPLEAINVKTTRKSKK